MTCCELTPFVSICLRQIVRVPCLTCMLVRIVPLPPTLTEPCKVVLTRPNYLVWHGRIRTRRVCVVGLLWEGVYVIQWLLLFLLVWVIGSVGYVCEGFLGDENGFLLKFAYEGSYGVSWPSGLLHWTQVLALSECGFKSRTGRSRRLSPWARHSTIILLHRSDGT